MAIRTVSEEYNPPKNGTVWKFFKYKTEKETIAYGGKYIDCEVIRNGLQYPVQNGNDNSVLAYDRWLKADTGSGFMASNIIEKTLESGIITQQKQQKKFPYGFCAFDSLEDAEQCQYSFNGSLLIELEARGIYLKGDGGYGKEFVLCRELYIPSTVKNKLIELHNQQWETVLRANGFTPKQKRRK